MVRLLSHGTSVGKSKGTLFLRKRYPRFTSVVRLPGIDESQYARGSQSSAKKDRNKPSEKATTNSIAEKPCKRN